MKKNIRKIFTAVLLLTATIALVSFKILQDDPWTEKQLLDPAKLAKILNDPNAKKPELLNIGPMDRIKYAKNIGVGSTPEGMDKFKAHVDKLPLEKDIVIYCGCCKMENCPNIKQTLLYLELRGYTNYKVLNIPENLEDDWIKKGYPMP